MNVSPDDCFSLRGLLLPACIVFSGLMHLVLFILMNQEPVYREMTVREDVSYEAMNIQIVLNQVSVMPDEPEVIVKKEEKKEKKVIVVKEAPTKVVLYEPKDDTPPVEEDEDKEPETVEPEDVPEEIAVSISTEERDAMANTYWSQVCRSIARGIRYPGRAKANRWTGRVVVHLVVESLLAISKWRFLRLVSNPYAVQ